MRRVNEIRDPLFRHVSQMKLFGVDAIAVDHSNGHRYARAIWNGESSDPYLDIRDHATTPGSYRLFFNCYAENGTGRVRVFTRDANTTSYGAAVVDVAVSDRQTIRKAVGPFTLKASSIVRIVPPKTEGGLIMITEVNLELDSTFDQSQPYFDYSLMPLERLGGGLT